VTHTVRTSTGSLSNACRTERFTTVFSLLHLGTRARTELLCTPYRAGTYAKGCIATFKRAAKGTTTHNTLNPTRQDNDHPFLLTLFVRTS
jgi:hypothetical protein